VAKHIHPNEDERVDSQPKYLASPSHAESATLARRILDDVTSLEIRDIQFPSDVKYTCWYASVKGSPRRPVINLGLFPNAVVNVEFRYIRFLSPSLRDQLAWQNKNWLYARIADSAFTLAEVMPIVHQYVQRCEDALQNNELKRGGTSDAEALLAEVLYATGLDVAEGERPESLRNDQGRLLQLDFQLPSLRIAIEVQGPHHFEDFYGKPEQLTRRQENDRFKVQRCLAQGISMIWMLSQGIQNELVRLPFADQCEHMRKLLDDVQHNHPSFVLWKSPQAAPEIRAKW
jgi:hypothetical protein